MVRKTTHPIGSVLAAVGKSVLYLLFYLAVQLLVAAIYSVAAMVDLVLTYQELEPAQLAQQFFQRALVESDSVTLAAM